MNKQYSKGWIKLFSVISYITFGIGIILGIVFPIIFITSNYVYSDSFFIDLQYLEYLSIFDQVVIMAIIFELVNLFIWSLCRVVIGIANDIRDIRNKQLSN